MGKHDLFIYILHGCDTIQVFKLLVFWNITYTDDHKNGRRVEDLIQCKTRFMEALVECIQVELDIAGSYTIT